MKTLSYLNNASVKTLLLLLLITFATYNCNSDVNRDRDSFLYFKENLRADMDYQELIEKFGQPDRDIGSGIHIYVYDLSDSTEVWIGYTDKIIYARHMDADQNLLENLIP